MSVNVTPDYSSALQTNIVLHAKPLFKVLLISIEADLQEFFFLMYLLLAISRIVIGIHSGHRLVLQRNSVLSIIFISYPHEANILQIHT